MTSWAEPGKGVYLRENSTGQTVMVGRFDGTLPGPENRMRPLTETFRTDGVAVLQRCRRAAGEWMSIDEIGFLETGCPEYCRAILDLMGQKRLIAVVRKQNLPFLRALCSRKDAFLVDMDAPFGILGCVIMASGLGKRFGGNKLMANFGGRPLIQYALDATTDIFASRVVVTRHRDVAALCRRQQVEVVFHDLPRRSDTVRLGIKAVQAAVPVSGCLFCPADQPLLSWQTVAALALCAANAPAAIWRPAWQGQPGAPVLFPLRTFNELENLPSGHGGGIVLKRYPGDIRLLPLCSQWELADVDTPEQLSRLERQKTL